MEVAMTEQKQVIRAGNSPVKGQRTINSAFVRIDYQDCEVVKGTVEELFQQIEDARELARYPSMVNNYQKLLQAAYEAGWLAVVEPGTFEADGTIIKIGPVNGASLSLGPGPAQ